MSTERILFTVELTLYTPILTQAAGAIGFGLDAAMRRDRADRPALPGTLVKGNLRHAWDALMEIAGKDFGFNTGYWLGNPSADSSFDEPDRGLLRFDEWFSDLAWSDADQARPRYRISVDPQTGAAATGMLQTVESPYAAGREITFTGCIRATLDDTQINDLARRIRQGLLFVPAVGALKGNGFGRVAKAKVSWEEAKPEKPEKRDWKGVIRVGLRVRPAAPFCFARPALGEKNHFESEDFIPGGALVAAILSRIDEDPDRWRQLAQERDRLHLTHARPVPAGATRRPIAIPLTLVKAGEDFRHLSADATAAPISGEAPLFQTDWKNEDWTSATGICNSGLAVDLIRRLRIRNKIDASKGKAEEGILFSAEVVEPDIDPKTGAPRIEWLANLDLSQTADPAALLGELDDLLREPLTNLGKTKVDADLILEHEPFAPARPSTPGTDDHVAIYLQSPARLLPSGFQCAATNAGVDLERAYRDAWHSLSGGVLELTGFLAHQRLFGGDYWWHRFRAKHGARGYHPELLTLEGSVFLLRIRDPDYAPSVLDCWLARGLPQVDAGAGGDAWDRNPWTCANGYGEIALDLDFGEDAREHDHE